MTRATPPDKLRLGGMALRNGLLVHGPTHWAAAVRAPDGAIRVASGPKPELGAHAAERVPGARGIAKLAQAVAIIPAVKRALPEARLPMQDARTVGAMVAAALGGQAIRGGRRGEVAREGAAALISMVPALLALRSGDLASYHGVEHKAIGAYEQGGDAADATKEHDRCGSHLVAPLLASAVAGNAAMRRSGMRGPAAEGAVGLASLGFAVEVFSWSERHPESRVTRALRRPGHAIQSAVGTREPTPEQLEVGRAALEEILRVENSSSSPPGPAAGDR